VKILAICGSPHRGNTYEVLSKIEEDYPDIDYKLLMLGELNLQKCIGCYGCVLYGEEHCPLKDDRDMIIQEIMDADGVIFASSINVNHIPALMKDFMGRLGFMSHRPPFYGKYAMVMAVCAMFGAKQANEYMKGIFTTFGFDVVSCAELGVATKTKKEIAWNQEKVTKAFNTLIDRIKQGQKSTPTLRQILHFYLFKTISEYNKEHYQADYQYYKDKTEFASDRKPSFFKKMLAQLMVKNMMWDFSKNRL